MKMGDSINTVFEHILCMTYVIAVSSDIDYLESCRLLCIAKCSADLKIHFMLLPISQGNIPQ